MTVLPPTLTQPQSPLQLGLQRQTEPSLNCLWFSYGVFDAEGNTMYGQDIYTRLKVFDKFNSVTYCRLFLQLFVWVYENATRAEAPA
jgi:hypothetical protein